MRGSKPPAKYGVRVGISSKKVFQEDYSPPIEIYRAKRQIPQQTRPPRLLNYPAVPNFDDAVRRAKKSRKCLHCLGRSDRIFKSNMEPFPLSEWTAIQRRGQPPA